MKEKELQKAIVDTAHLLGWRVAHFRTAMNKRGAYMTPVGADGKGWPDLCLVRERVVFAEVKAGKNTLDPEQVVWRDRLAAAGGEWHLWDENAWNEGLVERVLR
jgi:hypothetical protein